MSVSDSADTARSGRPSRHESFLIVRNFRYLKLAAALAVVSLILYLADVPYGSRYGGTWAGYALGTVGALLILWLTWFGYRKRTYGQDHGVLVARLSAHVYLGLSLIVVATLHTGFHFGWNIHTLAYALMCLVVASGAFGVFTYAHYPRLMTENRQSTTMRQMLGRIASLNDELRTGAMGLDDRSAALVRRSIESTEIGGSVWRQLSGNYPQCSTAAALAGFAGEATTGFSDSESATRQTRLLLEEKAALLTRVRQDISYKAIMDIWLYFHVPLSFALLAALIAHVVAVFFLW
ncbi:MAG: hypothetical protein JO267_14630 [Alphaproteobacteria bacterium]|nr:hypothetical protein [Alphaproteobacteria bacterium]